MATKTSSLDANFSQQVTGLQSQSQATWQPRLQGQQSRQMMPKLNDWSGDLFDWEGMASAFNRDKANATFTSAIADPNNPGTTGDLVISTVQIDYLAVMERAFRARHTMSRPRALCQAMGRRRGHGSPTGVMGQAVLAYVTQLKTLANQS